MFGLIIRKSKVLKCNQKLSAGFRNHCRSLGKLSAGLSATAEVWVNYRQGFQPLPKFG
jgi:hypothetical protein